MRHRKKTKRLGRMSSHRKATMSSLAKALFVKEAIRTTKTKAKVASSYIEKLITTAKKNTPEAKRVVFSLIRDKDLIETLFKEIAPRFKNRAGGYTRMIPLYPRRGDGSPMAILELVEKKPKTVKLPAKKAKKETVKKAEPKKEVRPQPAEKKEQKIAPPPKADVKEEIQKEKAKREDKKVKKGGFLNKFRRYFRGKAK